MCVNNLSTTEWVKAIAVGVVTSLILSAIMVPAFRAGLPPIPEPPSLAFADTVLGSGQPLWVGLLFHVVYVTVWSVVFMMLFRDRPTFLRALGLALILWIMALAVFFPINGWGFAGLAVSPKLIPAALVPHLLFALVLWGLCRLVFGAASQPVARRSARDTVDR